MDKLENNKGLKMIGVIGCGNMASAIVRGIYSKYPANKFITYTPSFTRANALAKEVDGIAVKELKELHEVKTLIIGCKPQQFAALANDLIKELDLENIHIISIMAAINVETISKKLNTKSITRIMPNTPVQFGEGINLFYHSDFVPEANKKNIEELFSSISKVYRMPDELTFDKVTTISGSGPAYIFYLTQLLAENLEAWGIDSSSSSEMAIQLLKGSVLLMENRGQDSLSELVDKVTSKKGVTIEAMDSFKESHLDDIMKKALKAAFKRSEEMTKEFS